MNCTRIQSMVSAYLDGELHGDDMWLVRDHCSQCADCASELEAMRRVKSAGKRLARVEPAIDTLDSLKVAVRLDSKTKRKADHPYKLVAATLVAAMVLGWAVASNSTPVARQVPQDQTNTSTESDVYASGLDMPGAYAPASLASQRD